jgi:hypothetical protein
VVETSNISPDIEELLTAFRDGRREALAKSDVAIYVDGSLLTGDLASASSEIEFLAVATAPL